MEEIIRKINELITEINNKLKCCDEYDKNILVSTKKDAESIISLLSILKAKELPKPLDVFILPELLLSPPFSNYRIVEDMETEDRTQWVVLKDSENKIVELYSGDLIIRKKR